MNAMNSNNFNFLEHSCNHSWSECHFSEHSWCETARGIHVLDVAGFRGIVENCVIAAAERSAELGRK